MNFKKTLLALTVAGFASSAVASNGVEIDNGIWTLSQEGVALGQTEEFTATGALATKLDVFLTKEVPSNGKVSVKFNDGIEYTGAVASFTNTATDTTTTAGINTVTTDGTTAFADVVLGSGSFTFVKGSYDVAGEELVLTLGNGQPLLANGSFGLTFDGANVPKITDVATVTITSYDRDGAVIETFDTTISELQSQFALTINSDMAGEVNAVDCFEFVSGSDNAVSETLNGYPKFTVTDLSGSDMKAAASVTAMDVTLFGEFNETVDASTEWAGTFGISTAASATGADAQTAFATNAVKAEVNTTEVAGSKDGKEWFISYQTGASDALVTPFQFAATLDLSGATDTQNGYVIQPQVSFGSWDLEGGVINVPYLPVGFAGLSANVEISNEDASEDATIYVEAFDNEGTYYPRVEMSKVAAAHTVTKVSAQEIIDALGIANKPLKLSTTFTFETDGDVDAITLVPYYKQNESRINVLSDEYKGK